MNEFDRTRAKILGVLIRDARLHAGRSVTDCAQLLHLPEEMFLDIEIGEADISLPQLEALAIYLNVPLDHFWGDKTLGNYPQTNFDDMIGNRDFIIGSRLRVARETANRSIEDLAIDCKVPPSRIQAYESGEMPIPLFHLDRMARYLGHSLNYFMDDDEEGILAEHEAVQKLQTRFEDLSPEMQLFVTEPINISYLEIAVRLSKMDVNSLRTVAENILNITF